MNPSYFLTGEGPAFSLVFSAEEVLPYSSCAFELFSGVESFLFFFFLERMPSPLPRRLTAHVVSASLSPPTWNERSFFIFPPRVDPFSSYTFRSPRHYPTNVPEEKNLRPSFFLFPLRFKNGHPASGLREKGTFPLFPSLSLRKKVSPAPPVHSPSAYTEARQGLFFPPQRRIEKGISPSPSCPNP